MATNTTNYNLTKPDYEDDADIKDLNDNFDIIDVQMKILEDIISSLPSIFTLGIALATNGSLNVLTNPGKWYATSTAIATTITGIPAGLNTAFFGMTIPSVANSRYIQILIPNDDTGDWYKRRYTGSWQTWVKYSGTPVT